MYKIQEVASLFGLTSQALRYYEKEGLLFPDYVDPQNGYRYYSDSSIDRLTQLVQLRYLGFGIRQAKKYFDSSFSKEEKLSDLQRVIDICTYQMTIIRSSENYTSTYTIQEKTTRPHYSICIEKTAKDAKEVLCIYGQLMRTAIQKKIKLCCPVAFSLSYLGMDDTSNSARYFCELEVLEPEQEQTIFLPAQKVITVMFNGPHDNITDAYTALYQYINEKGLTQTGTAKEHYLGPYNPITNYCFVEIQIPIT